MRPFLKIRHLLPLAIAGLGVILGGCIVKSVYPFYTAKDVVFESALVGDWSENGAADDKETWNFAKLGDNAYQTTVISKSETNRFEAHLFRLKQQKFLDLCPAERPDNHLPLHYVFKIEQIQPTFKLSPMGLDWLVKLLEKNPKAIPHIRVPKEPGDTNRNDLVLTADTPELQEFIVKYSSDTNAFGEPSEWKRRK